MMLQMIDVVVHEVVECDRLFKRYGNECDRVEVVAAPRLHARGGGRRLDDMRQVKIELPPERDDRGPWIAVVFLRRDPLLLLVSGKHQVVGELRAHEAL